MGTLILRDSHRALEKKNGSTGKTKRSDINKD